MSRPGATFRQPGRDVGLVVIKAKSSSPQALGGGSVTEFAAVSRKLR